MLYVPVFEQDTLSSVQYWLNPGHWHSSHYAVMHVRNKNSFIQGRSPNVVNHKELLLKGRICSLGSKFFPLREVSNLKRDAIA